MAPRVAGRRCHVRAAPGSGSIPGRMRTLPAVLASALLLAGCAPRPAEPERPHPDLAAAVAAAMDAEARDDGAIQPWLDALAFAAENTVSPTSVGATAVALDALVHRTDPDALVYRRREAFARGVLRMREIWESIQPSSGAYAPLVAGLIARSMHTLTLITGEVRGADVWGSRRGCVRVARAFGPTDAAALGALERPSMVPARGPMTASVPGLLPFTRAAPSAILRADACALDARASSPVRGLREVVVDVAVDRDQDVTFALVTETAAVLEVGGQPALVREADAGDGAIMGFSRVRATEGVLRVVVRLADRGSGGSFELDVWGADGSRLPSSAPETGDIASSTARVIETLQPTHWGWDLAPLDADERDAAVAFAAASELALGEDRAAFRRLDGELDRERAQDAPFAPRLHILYQRALEASDEISDLRRSERSRDAARQVLAVWPDAWEAKLADARLAGERRGPDEGPFAALARLGVPVEDATASAMAGLSPPELAYVARVADGASLRDLAERAFAALVQRAPGSMLVAEADAVVHDRAGPEAVQAACSGGLSRATTGCLNARRAVGDLDGALDEITRLRDLRDAPQALREVELALRIDKGDLAGVLAVYDEMSPAQRPMMPALGFAIARGDAEAARSRLVRDEATASDAPTAIPSLVQLLEGGSPEAKDLEREGAELVAKDRKQPAMPGAATAVLRRVEHYGLDASGMLRFIVYDLRRVGGTTDVDQNAASALPFVEGRGTSRLLRRRVLKKDGRVLHPEGASMAAQGNTDLSQLETGDYVEQIVHGFYLPNDQGHLVLDTPDLLPERTSVREAEIVIRHPEAIPMALWAHPRLGPAQVEKRGGYAFLTFRLQNAAPRRLEDDVPQLERGVRVSLGTQRWEDVARNVAETVRAMDVKDPFVERFARQAAGLKDGEQALKNKETIARVVDHVGDVIKEPRAWELTDMGSLGGATSIRASIEDREGSRSWIVAQALSSLGFDAEIAIAEPEPFATSEAVPPHTGRFRHPLVVVRTPEGQVWIDADLQGAPLPPGQVSPELRGRSALLASGQVVPVQGASESGGDQIDLQLKVDASGDARGTLVAVVRGRSAQAIADAFQLVVGSERTQMLRNIVLGWVPWADVEDVVLDAEGGAWQVRLRATIAISGFARPEGKNGETWVLPGVEPVHYVFPRAFATTLGTTYTAQRARATALSIESPIAFRMTRRIELPPGAVVERGAPAVTVEAPSLAAIRTARYEGSVISEEFVLSLPTGTIPVAEYPAFVERVQTVDSGFLAGMRIRVKR